MSILVSTLAIIGLCSLPVLFIACSSIVSQRRGDE